MDKRVRNLSLTPDFVLTLCEHIDEGVLICRLPDLQIAYSNGAISRYLYPTGTGELIKLDSILPKEKIENIRQGLSVDVSIENHTFHVSSSLFGEHVLLVFHDLTQVIGINKKIEELSKLNYQIQRVLEQYVDDRIYITDEKGITLFVGSLTAMKCGVTTEYLMNKSVYELEKEKVFYPSVSILVLESKQPQVVIQNTGAAENLIAFGVPIFNDAGELTHVVSIARDFSKHIEIGKMLVEMSKEYTFTSKDIDSSNGIVTCSEKMLDIITLAKMIAPTSTTVLLTGETGTGKEVFANLIFQTSNRSEKPFIKINCGAISPNIVESELFGYEPGSFTGAKKGGQIGLIEAANGGTLFLDEISELPYSQQVKLLQVLQEQTITRVGGTKSIKLDVRIIAATNKNLEELMAKGEFREDLYYRLNVVTINIPPLRNRREDVPLLLKHFIQRFNTLYKRNTEFERTAFLCLCNYHWPGNVRELENTVERLVITSESPFITADQLSPRIGADSCEYRSRVEVHQIMDLESAVQEVEHRLIQMAMENSSSEEQAADLLGVSQSTISRKIKKYGIRK